MEQRRDALLTQAVHWLWSQQAADGGWHSEVHGILKGGQAWTPYIYDALLGVPDSIYSITTDQHKSAGQFLWTHLDSVGAMGLSNPVVLEYPNYATAYTIRALKRSPCCQDSTINSFYLQEQQFTYERGIEIDHPAFGAWGFGETDLPLGEVGHVDLSHTRRAIEAIGIAGPFLNTSWHELAEVFLGRLQKIGEDNYDGGFCASTYTLGTNKADAYDRPSCTSYASATADGVLALLAVGVSIEDQRVQDAKAWLLQHPRWDYPEGIPPNEPGQWGEVLFFYHLSVRAQAYAALGISDWEEELLDLLEPEIHPDGYFLNPAGAPNKENDPLLATALVVRALCAMQN